MLSDVSAAEAEKERRAQQLLLDAQEVRTVPCRTVPSLPSVASPAASISSYLFVRLRASLFLLSSLPPSYRTITLFARMHMRTCTCTWLP